MKITVERLANGLYAISSPGHPTLIGAAASTAVTMNHLIFGDEAAASSQIAYYPDQPEEIKKELVQ